MPLLQVCILSRQKATELRMAAFDCQMHSSSAFPILSREQLLGVLVRVRLKTTETSDMG